MATQQPQKTLVLPERDDDAIDALLADPRFGPDYMVTITISRKSSNLTPKLRAGIVCPLLQVKGVAQALCDLVTGGGQLKVEVEHMIDGNRKRLLSPWFEAFADTPKIGMPYENLTIEWDSSGGPNSDGIWVPVPRAGTNARNAQAAEAGGYAPPVMAGPRLAQPPAFPVVQRGFDGALLPPPPQMVPASLRVYPADVQWQAVAANHERQYGVRPSLEPVDIALQWKTATSNELERATATTARLEERNEGLRDKMSSALDAANRRMADLEKKLAESEHARVREVEKAEAKAREEKRDLQIEAMRAEFARSQNTAPAAKAGLSDAAIGAMVTGATGILTAWMTSQSAAADRQMQMMLTLGKPPPPAPSVIEQFTPVIAAMGPIAGPALAAWLQNQSPAAKMELEDARAQQQQVMFSMVMEQVKSMIPSDAPEPIWFRPVMTVLEGMMGAVKTAAITSGMNKMPALPNPQEQQREVHQHQQPPVQQREQQGPIEAQVEQAPVQDAPIETHPANLEMLIDGLSEIDKEAGSVTRFVMRAMHANGVHPLFFTPEWVSIIFALHHVPQGQEKEDRAADIVPEIVDHLEHCRKYQLLPPDFAEVFERPELLAQLVNLMPLGMTDRPYADMLLEMFVDEVTSRERERKLEFGEDNEDEDDDESGETEVEAAGDPTGT